MSYLNNNPSRNNILNTIKSALEQTTATPFMHQHATALTSLVQPAEAAWITLFEQNFTSLQGIFIATKNSQETIDNLKQLSQSNNWEHIFCAEKAIVDTANKHNWQIPLHNNLSTCHVSITSCECLVARTGSLMLSSTLTQGRTASVYAPIHVCVAKKDQLVYDIENAWQLMHQKYGTQLPSSISLATGPSRTADIEKTLVVGVHGPKQVFCIVEG